MERRVDQLHRERQALERYVKRPTRARLSRVVQLLYKQVWNVSLRVTGHAEDAAAWKRTYPARQDAIAPQ